MADLHTHPWPSLLPRLENDEGTVAAEQDAGFSYVVLKSHEGSSVERAVIAGKGVYGGIVLNGTVGGANPYAVEVAARLGGRVVWMPTVSAPNHRERAGSPELSVHKEMDLGCVAVLDDQGELRREWYPILDLVAEHDLLLASGHLSAAETVVLFRAARGAGVRRMMVNHPMMAFLAWNGTVGAALRELDVYLELGILPDLIGGTSRSSIQLADSYPSSLLVFGSDLGHADFPSPRTAVGPWLADLQAVVGSERAKQIMTSQTRSLLLP